MTLPIYLDYAATTPVDERVAARMWEFMTRSGHFANPASLAHAPGLKAKDAVEHARLQVAHAICADASEIIWTSGATEANNLALKGASSLYQQRGKHIITVKTEHKAVLDTMAQLEKQGFQVTYLTPASNGIVSVEQVEQALRSDTMMVSIMHVNNETGIIQDVHSIAELTASKGILCHVDAAQSAGKLPIDVQMSPIDLISMSAHKTYGPKGMGALYVRKKPRVRVAAQIHGGGQEQGMRSGTLATHQIVGMGEAYALAVAERDMALAHQFNLRALFLEALGSVPYRLNTDISNAYPGILNLCFPGITSAALMESLPMLAMASGSACDAKGVEPSYVLRAMGLTKEQAQSAVRISFGRFTTQEEMILAASQIEQAISNG